MRGLHQERLQRVQLLSGHGEVWRAGKGETDVRDASVLAADVAGDGRLFQLRTGRVDADAGGAAAEGTTEV